MKGKHGMVEATIIAGKIQQTIRDLNQLIERAADVNCKVEIDVVQMESIRTPFPLPVISAKVLRHIEQD